MTAQQARECMRELLSNELWKISKVIEAGRALTEKELHALAENEACQVWEDADTRHY